MLKRTQTTASHAAGRPKKLDATLACGVRVLCAVLVVASAVLFVGALVQEASGTRRVSLDAEGKGMKDEDSKRKFRLEGSWELEVISNPGPGAPPPFKALATFDAGGGCVETIMLPPVTPAHGAWVRTGNQTFTFAVVHHLLDAGGTFIGTIRAKSQVRLTSPDEFEATFEGTLYDPLGNALFPLSGRETGRRIKVN